MNQTLHHDLVNKIPKLILINILQEICGVSQENGQCNVVTGWDFTRDHIWPPTHTLFLIGVSLFLLELWSTLHRGDQGVVNVCIDINNNLIIRRLPRRFLFFCFRLSELHQHQQLWLRCCKTV